MTIFYLIGTAMLLLGLYLDIRSMGYRKENHPTVVSANWFKYSAVSFRPWKYRQYWDEPGYKYFMASRIVLLCAVLLAVINGFLNF